MRISFWRALLGAIVLLVFARPGVALAQYEVLTDRTTITLAVVADPDVPGRVNLRAEVVSAFGTGMPDGRITFHDMATQRVLGWTSVAQPQITVEGLAPGRHMLRADFSGSTGYMPLITLPSQSAEMPLDILVRPVLTLSSSDEVIAPGGLVTFNVAVAGTAGVPGGAVTLRDGDEVVIAHLRLDQAGMAAFTTSALLSGTRSISASYEGDGRYAAAATQIQQQVTSPLAAVTPRR